MRMNASYTFQTFVRFCTYLINSEIIRWDRTASYIGLVIKVFKISFAPVSLYFA